MTSTFAGAESATAGIARRVWVDPRVARQSLYLGQSKPVRLDADRASLLVTPEDSSTARVPLARVERVVSGVHATWHGAALLACAQACVPVVFAGTRGSACASLDPIRQTSGTLDAELTLFAEAPDAEAAWRDGLRVLRGRLLRGLWNDQGWPPGGLLWEEQRRTFVYQGGRPARRIADVDARCYAVVAAQLPAQGVALRYATRAGRWIEVALDLAATLHDLRELARPMENHARCGPKLRAVAFESSESVQTDVVGWCLLILRRSALEHLKPWR